LIARIKQLVEQCKQARKVRFHYVAGHAGIKGNEMVDQLAKEAACPIE